MSTDKYTYQDAEAPQTGVGFYNEQVRRGFIAKVYGILSIQLLITFGMVALFSLVPSVKQAVQSSPALVWGAYVMTFVIVLVLACCEGPRRHFPTNYILLFSFTICEGYLVGVIASLYSPHAVFLATITTVVIVVSLTIYAWQTKIDFTWMGGILLCVLISFSLMGFFMWFFPYNPITNKIYAALGALIFSFYLLYDTQLLIGGKHKRYQISPEEYVFAALNLYLDIIYIFLYLLSLFGNK
jgi:FtsH-binding integral membrane protein